MTMSPLPWQMGLSSHVEERELNATNYLRILTPGPITLIFLSPLAPQTLPTLSFHQEHSLVGGLVELFFQQGQENGIASAYLLTTRLGSPVLYQYQQHLSY